MNLLDVTEHGEVAVVAMNRPPANAFSPEFVADHLTVLADLASSSPGAVVLTGSGNFFSGGADLRLVPELDDDSLAALARDVNGMFAGWYTLPRPVVAAANGHAVAGGLVLALCADVRVGPSTGQFGLTEVKAGIPFPSAAMAVVRGELAPGALRRLVLRGELLSAAVALELGVFDETVADDAVLARAIDLASDMAALPRHSFETIKARVRSGAFDRDRGRFGGAEGAKAATAESRDAARRLLDER